MYYAIQIIESKTGGIISETLVTIKEMQSLGEAKARSFQYKCPDDKCAKAMRPVFPKKERKGGKEVHSSHFRAPTAHKRLCDGEGAVKRILEQQSLSKPKDSPIYEPVRRTDFPVNFDERTRIKQSIDSRDLLADGSNSPNAALSKSIAGGALEGSQSHTSQSTAGHLRKFVEAYENPPLPLWEMPIRINKCPARTYAETFIQVSQAVDRTGYIATRHIYRGPYQKHTSYSSGIVIIFDALTANQRKLTVWVNKILGPPKVRQELIDRLEKAENEGHATIYVLGRFRLFRGREEVKYTIDVETLGEVWVSLNDDRQVAINSHNEDLPPSPQ